MITLGSSDLFMVVFSDEHGQLPPRHHRCGWQLCEINVVIPLNPMEPWMATVIGVELDETVEQTA
jgi:hypothetical protein